MKCPHCGSFKIKGIGNPISSGGKAFYSRQCQECHYTWSTPDRLPMSMVPVVRGVPPPDDEVPAEALDLPMTRDEQPTPHQPPHPAPVPVMVTVVEKVLRLADGFNPATVQVGDVVLFAGKKGQEHRLEIVSVAAKTILGDVDGRPDQRVKRAKLLGKVVRG